MDFFSAQDHARRISRWLMLWFVLAVLGIIGTVYVTTALAVFYFTGAALGEESPWNVHLLVVVVLGVGGLILAGSLYKSVVLARQGGARVAEELGGRLVARSTTHPLERRLINVVEEMAIASGIPAPPVYVLDDENGINAFAAGANPNEAVVAVTRGTLEQLTRDELQGVVAHEFSHILNGDMRLNLRLLGVLHGILLLTLAGRTLMRGARGGDRNAGAIAISGAMLVAAGYVGTLCGKMIKAGVSRQREFLADASAVQFTRNPSGIAGALARIEAIGSNVQHPQAEEASHMFFGTSARFSKLLATHPPLDERIRRIDPLYRPRKRMKDRADAVRMAADTGNGLTSSLVGASVGTVTPRDVDSGRALIEGLPSGVIEQVHTGHGARIILCALLLSKEPGIRARQITLVTERLGSESGEASAQQFPTISTLEAGKRLPLLDLALPALGELPGPERRELIALTDELIRADGRTSPFEYVARRLLRAVLQPEAANRSRPASPAELRSGAATLLALLARAGSDDVATAVAAFDAAITRTGFEGHWRYEDHASGFSSTQLDTILGNLAGTHPPFRRRLVEACATAVLHDGRVAPVELELLRAVCQALDCPLPLSIGNAE